MKKTLCVLAFACLIAAVTLPAAAAQNLDDFLTSISDQTPQAFSERVGVHDAAKLRRQQENLHRMLVSERVAEAMQAPMRIEVDRSQIQQLLDERGRQRTHKLLIGVAGSVDARIDLRDAAGEHGVRRLAHGAARTSDDGLVWTGAAVSQGAFGVRVHFTGVDLPRGSALYVYNAEGAAFGPYTGRGPNANGEFWSNMVPGDTVYVQLRQPAGAPPASFRIGDIGHVDAALIGASPEASNLCSYNAECVVSASCSSSNAVADAEDAVARITFVSGAFLYLCSGGLLADTDTATTIPYFVTANHCISKSSEANSMEAVFLYRAAQCGDTSGCSSPSSTLPRTVGATILSTSSTSDYTLMQLAEPAPAGTVLLGWNATAVANSNGTALYRISHPSGAPQAYSEHVVDTDRPTCRSWPRGDWIYSSDIFGATEGGSSGSPVVNGAGQVVGQLSGACGFNVNDTCDSAQNATVDGALAAYFSAVAQYLDPAGGGGGGGGGGGCSLGAVGDSCTADADCCSNKCRGPNGRKTCK
jgi:V8-like Glu-specific endopeptidase